MSVFVDAKEGAMNGRKVKLTSASVILAWGSVEAIDEILLTIYKYYGVYVRQDSS